MSAGIAGVASRTDKYRFPVHFPAGTRWYEKRGRADSLRNAMKRARPKKGRKPKRKKKSDRQTKYRAYLQSDEWKEVRNLILKRDHASCVICHSTLFLHVHHRHYQTFQKETGEELATLCKGCHSRLHREGWKAARMGDLVLRAIR